MERTICFCNSARAWGGGEKWHLDAALAMAKRGCRVFVMAGKGTALYERARSYPELTVHPMRFSGLDFLNPVALGACAAFFRSRGISRVVLGLPADLKTAGLAARLAGVAGIYYRRGSALPVRNSLLNRLLYGRLLTGLIVNSQETKRLVFANNPSLLDPAKVHVLYNGLDIPEFDAALAHVPAPAEREKAECVIGNAGRITGQKGQRYLIHMSRALRDANVPHRLRIAGDGEKRAELERLAADLGLGDTVIFDGFMEDMAPFWRGIDLFVLSSLWEGFGYVLAEAMLAQRPVIAFDANSMPELVRHGETGLLAPPPAPDEDDARVGSRLAAAVAALIADNNEMARLAGNGRAFCQKTFDQEQRMDDLFALLWVDTTYANGA